jgi:hypothetical protein
MLQRPTERYVQEVHQEVLGQMVQGPTERYFHEVHQEVLGKYGWCESGDVHYVPCSVGIVRGAGVEVMM